MSKVNSILLRVFRISLFILLISPIAPIVLVAILVWGISTFVGKVFYYIEALFCKVLFLCELYVTICHVFCKNISTKGEDDDNIV